MLFPQNFYAWAVVIATLLGIGASTALFTRLLGGMGMFRDAIADVLGDEAWLDRRNDLDDLWRRITRRVFLPGLSDSSDKSSAQFLVALNEAMTGAIPDRRSRYYEKNVRRTATIRWVDKDKRIVEIIDTMNCEVVVFARQDQAYEVRCSPPVGRDLADYSIVVLSARVDGKEWLGKDGRNISPEGILEIPLKALSTHTLSRELKFKQDLKEDPLLHLSCGHVTWGMTVTVVNLESDLKTIWEEIGISNVFQLEKNERCLLQLTTRAALFPEQGISLILTSPHIN